MTAAEAAEAAVAAAEAVAVAAAEAAVAVAAEGVIITYQNIVRRGKRYSLKRK